MRVRKGSGVAADGNESVAPRSVNEGNTPRGPGGTGRRKIHPRFANTAGAGGLARVDPNYEAHHQRQIRRRARRGHRGWRGEMGGAFLHAHGVRTTGRKPAVRRSGRSGLTMKPTSNSGKLTRRGVSKKRRGGRRWFDHWISPGAEAGGRRTERDVLCAQRVFAHRPGWSDHDARRGGQTRAVAAADAGQAGVIFSGWRRIVADRCSGPADLRSAGPTRRRA